MVASSATKLTITAIVVCLAACSDSVDDPVDAGSATGASFERPINLVFKIHIEPQGSLPMYKTRRDDVEAVRKLAEQHGLKLTLHGNGKFWQYAREQGDEPIVRTWLANGHTVGLHAHSVYNAIDAQHAWKNATQEQEKDSAFVDALWTDHERELKALLPDVKITESTPYDSDSPTFESRMTARGYTIVGGGREEISEQWFGHHPFHPFRIGAQMLEEKLTSKVVLVSHYSQFTEAAVHGPPATKVFSDQTLAHHKVGFLQIYLNRLHAERTGDPLDKVWSYGFLTHDNNSPESIRAELENYITWINDNFGKGKKSLRGNLIVKPSTLSDVSDDYIAWEKEHPNTSSFHVATPTIGAGQKINELDEATRKKIYPGPFWGMAELLRADKDNVVDYVANVSDFEAQGVSCHELAFGARADATRKKRWLCYKESDGAATINMQTVTGSANVKKWNVRDKQSSVVASTAIEVGAEPVIVDLSP